MDQYMQRALDEARRSQAEGGAPYGAVLRRGDTILSASGNLTHKNGDPTSHAEMEVIRMLGLGIDLSDTVMVASAHPCLMCAGTMLMFKIPKLIVGAAWPGHEASRALLEAQGVEVEILDLPEARAILQAD